MVWYDSMHLKLTINQKLCNKDYRLVHLSGCVQQYKTQSNNSTPQCFLKGRKYPTQKFSGSASNPFLPYYGYDEIVANNLYSIY